LEGIPKPDEPVEIEAPKEPGEEVSEIEHPKEEPVEASEPREEAPKKDDEEVPKKKEDEEEQVREEEEIETAVMNPQLCFEEDSPREQQRIVSVQFKWGGRGFVQKRTLRRQINVQVKNIDARGGERQEYSISVDITDKIQKLHDHL
jgi:hypothetical protein